MTEKERKSPAQLATAKLRHLRRRDVFPAVEYTHRETIFSEHFPLSFPKRGYPEIRESGEGSTSGGSGGGLLLREAASFERILGSRSSVAAVKYERGMNCEVVGTPFDPAYTARVSLTQR